MTSAQGTVSLINSHRRLPRLLLSDLIPLPLSSKEVSEVDGDIESTKHLISSSSPNRLLSGCVDSPCLEEIHGQRGQVQSQVVKR